MAENLFILMKHEWILVGILLFLILMKLMQPSEKTSNQSLLLFANLLLGVNLVAGFFINETGFLFGEMFRNNPLIVFEKNILSLATLLVSAFAYPWLQRHPHAYEFYMLKVSTLLGMFFMISSGNLLMFYLGLELATIPLAALANFDLHRKRSSEAAMKMIMMSAFASGIILFGISLLYGMTGTLSLELLPTLISTDPLCVFALILLLAGFGFKISAVPFHLWTADVYEGSPVSVTAYLSVVSKGAVLFVMTSVLYGAFRPLEDVWYQVIFLLAVATMVIGNLFAIRQTNMKRLLAFSSIAQVGFILVGMSGISAEGETSVIYFVLIYVFSNLGAFGVVSLISAATGKELADDYQGLYRTNPFLTWMLALSLFSLAGIPPAAGFFAKFFLLLAGAGSGNYLLLVIAALNMVVSLYYYLFVIKLMFTAHNDNPIPVIKTPALPLAGLMVCLAGIVIGGVYGNIHAYIYSLVK
jgi:NADH-quinone oxidoreductase subunit N